MNIGNVVLRFVWVVYCVCSAVRTYLLSISFITTHSQGLNPRREQHHLRFVISGECACVLFCVSLMDFNLRTFLFSLCLPTGRAKWGNTYMEILVSSCTKHMLFKVARVGSVAPSATISFFCYF